MQERCPIIPIPAVCNNLHSECPVSTRSFKLSIVHDSLAPIAELLTTSLNDLSFAVVDTTQQFDERNDTHNTNSHSHGTRITLSVAALHQLPLLSSACHSASIDDACIQQTGYELHVDAATGIAIRAPSAVGVMHGVQSLLQLLLPCSPALYGAQAACTVPCLQVCVLLLRGLLRVKQGGGGVVCKKGLLHPGDTLGCIQSLASTCSHKVADVARFRWRGLLLDVGRYFYSVSFIKRVLDIMALYKMTHFHWHLTEDQVCDGGGVLCMMCFDTHTHTECGVFPGTHTHTHVHGPSQHPHHTLHTIPTTPPQQGWRIEIKRYPLLTTKGAWRAPPPEGPPSANAATDAAPLPPDTQLSPEGLYGGFYTQQQVREVVEYARNRGIEVVPEIEMPGHCCAALACFPQLSCMRVCECFLCIFICVDVCVFLFVCVDVCR